MRQRKNSKNLKEKELKALKSILLAASLEKILE